MRFTLATLLALSTSTLASFCYTTGAIGRTSDIVSSHKQFCLMAGSKPIPGYGEYSFAYQILLTDGQLRPVNIQLKNKTNKPWYVLKTPCEADIKWLLANCNHNGGTQGGVTDLDMGTLTIDVQDWAKPTRPPGA